jgi:hypothetical protein
VKRYLYDDQFSLKPGKAREFAQWLATHEEKLRLTCPGGVDYVGAYAVVHTTDDEAGDIRIEWGMDAYSAIDALDAAMHGPGPLHELLDEMRRFAERDRFRRHGSRTLLTAMGGKPARRATGPASARTAVLAVAGGVVSGATGKGCATLRA